MWLPTRRWFTGAAVLGVAALAALVWPGGALLLVALDVAWLALLAIDAWRVSGLPARTLTVHREAPPAFSVGRPMPVTLVWRHAAGAPLVLRVREDLVPHVAIVGPVERRLTVPAGRALREALTVRPLSRGKGTAQQIHVRMRGPLGLVWLQRRIALPWSITVYPNLVGASLRALPTQSLRRREAGLRNVRRIGEGRVFESMKEWVPGDDTRTIDWKATARRGKVMARQYEDERRQQVMIVIDAGRLLTAESDGVPRLEAVAEAALHLAYSVVTHDDDIGLMAFADEVQLFMPPARGRRALRMVLDGLAAIEGRLVEPNYPAAFGYLASRSRKRALTVLFTDVVDRTASAALLAHVGSLRPRHLPLAVTLRDAQLEQAASRRPRTGAEAFERAAAEELLLEREEALADMRGRGVIVLDVPAAAAARAVVEQYAVLKRRAAI